MKRQDGTARFIGGDQDQVIGRIADFYMAAAGRPHSGWVKGGHHGLSAD